MRAPILIIILGGLCLILLGYMHEQVHVAIFKGYGIESEVHYISSFPDFKTVPEKNCPNEACVLAHNINEAVSYPLMAILGFMYIATVIISIQLDMNNERRLT